MLARIRRSGPFVLALAAVGAVIFGFYAQSRSFPSSSNAERAWATLTMFAGNYVPLVPQEEPTPPDLLLVASIWAFVVTLAAALSLGLALTGRIFNATRLLFARPHLVVVGSGASASAIVNSALRRGIKTVLVTDSANSAAARTAAAGRTRISSVPDLADAAADVTVRGLIKRSENVVLATDSTAMNLVLRASVSSVWDSRTDGSRTFLSLLAVVHDPRLAEAMRAEEISTELPHGLITSPSDNVAEHVNHLIDAAATGLWRLNGERKRADLVVVQIIPVEPGPLDESNWALLPETIARWARRQAWGRTFLRGKRLDDGSYARLAPLKVIGEGEDLPACAVTVRIYVGSSSQSVVRMLADRLENIPRASLTIIIGEESTVQAAIASAAVGRVVRGRDWLRSATDDGWTPDQLVVADPADIGLDAALVVDDENMQWARVFDQTYQFMWAGDFAVTGWEPGAPLGDTVRQEIARVTAKAKLTARQDGSGVDLTAVRRKAIKSISDRYSSAFAAANLPTFLGRNGYRLVKLPPNVSVPPPAPIMTTEQVDNIAEMEHNDWRNRKWVDRSARSWGRRHAVNQMACAEFSSSRAANFNWSRLLSLGSEPNDRLVGTARDLGVPDPEKWPDAIRSMPDYNRRIVTETYPALAATFGYALVQMGRDSNTGWKLYRRVGEVTAVQRRAPWTWTTRTGDVMSADAGDWMVRDATGGARSVAESEFDSKYERVAASRFRQRGLVWARQTTADETVDTLEGPATARALDWVVRTASGVRFDPTAAVDTWPVPAAHFVASYSLYWPIDRSAEPG
ncbi:hypothetical protein [Rhodococcoides corynebacterioides]|uniref:hypothetical protein n=1 Tax=Rhodococcoides corynebacterioides TaxID=53972 RepID=UPI003ADB169C